MDIVTRSFFVGEINIVNTGNISVGENLDYFIEKYQQECLLKVLGYQLYKLLSLETSARMTALLDGAEFTNSSNTVEKWDGLKSSKNNLIAYYIYEKWTRSKATVTTGKSNTVQNFIQPPLSMDN